MKHPNIMCFNTFSNSDLHVFCSPFENSKNLSAFNTNWSWAAWDWTTWTAGIWGFAQLSYLDEKLRDAALAALGMRLQAWWMNELDWVIWNTDIQKWLKCKANDNMRTLTIMVSPRKVHRQKCGSFRLWSLHRWGPWILLCLRPCDISEPCCFWASAPARV